MVVVVSGTIGGIFRKNILGISDFKPSLYWASMPKNRHKGDYISILQTAVGLGFELLNNLK